jgi:penicillin-binding protein 1A
VANVRAGSVVQGGSTITQQLAKTLFLSSKQTIGRKIKELLLALKLEQRFTKDQILSIYLNRVYFGAGAYGIDAAARTYFGVPATRLSTYQSALLAGLLRAPSRFNPRASAVLAGDRAQIVLASMVEAGFLNREDADSALRARHDFRIDQTDQKGNRYYIDWVLDQIPGYLATSDWDIVVMTTIDPRIQLIAEKLISNTASVARAKKEASEAALVAMSPSGAVRAMIGGANYNQSQFNRAVQARRQPGSAFKPVVYLAGLEAGLSPDSPFVDAPLSIDGWRPKNFSGRFQGEVSLRQALAESINTVAVQVCETTGRRKVIEAAKRLGITSEMKPNASLALGSFEVSLIELTASYAVFANGGNAVWPYAIDAIRDRNGRLLYRRSAEGAVRVVAEDHAALLTGMLADVLERGTGRAARLTRPAAGKTGTSQNLRDAWFIGFTSDLVTGIWIGNDDDGPMLGVTGGGLPALLWRSFMADAHVGLPIKQLVALENARPAIPVDRTESPRARYRPNGNFIDQLLYQPPLTAR